MQLESGVVEAVDTASSTASQPLWEGPSSLVSADDVGRPARCSLSLAVRGAVGRLRVAGPGRGGRGAAPRCRHRLLRPHEHGQAHPTGARCFSRLLVRRPRASSSSRGATRRVAEAARVAEPGRCRRPPRLPRRGVAWPTAGRAGSTFVLPRSWVGTSATVVRRSRLASAYSSATWAGSRSCRTEVAIRVRSTTARRRRSFRLWSSPATRSTVSGSGSGRGWARREHDPRQDGRPVRGRARGVVGLECAVLGDVASAAAGSASSDSAN